MDFAHLLGLIDAGPPNFLLGVVAQPHMMLVQQIQQIGRLRKPHGHRVGQQVVGLLIADSHALQAANSFPCSSHAFVVKPTRGLVRQNQRGCDVIGIAGKLGGESGPASGSHTVALILAVGRVGQFFPERVTGMVGRPGQFIVCGQVQRFPVEGVDGGIERQLDGFIIAQLGARPPQHFADGIGHHLLGIGLVIDEPGGAPFQRGIELCGKLWRRRRLFEPRKQGKIGAVKRLLKHNIVLRIMRQHSVDHELHHAPLLEWHIALLADAPVTQQGHAAHGMIEVSERRDRRHVAGRLLGYFQDRFAVFFLPAAASGEEAKIFRLSGGEQGFPQRPVSRQLHFDRCQIDFPRFSR